MSDDLKDELRWMAQGAVNPRAAAQALKRIKALEERLRNIEYITREAKGPVIREVRTEVAQALRTGGGE